MNEQNQIEIYQSEDGQIQLDVRIEEETVWLTLNQISYLFGRDKSVISRHISNVYKEQELTEISTVAKYATVQTEGGRQIQRELEFFNLDVIISVGYRVKSKRGTQFRIWANRVLKEFLQNGLLIDGNGNKLIDDSALVGITLMIAESKPKEKDLIVNIILNLLNRN